MRLKYNDWYLIGALAAIGFFLRVYFLGYQSFWIDEVFSVNAAQGILEHGYPLLDSGVVYSRDILNTYFISFFMFLFGETHFGARLVSVIFGTLMIPLIYYFGKEFGDRKIGLISAVFVAFSVWEIAWSRQARMYQQLQFFYFISLIFFYRLVKNDKLRDFFLTALFTILAILSHSLGYTLLLVYLLYFVIINLKNLISKDFWKLIIFESKQKIFDYYRKNRIVFLLGSLLLISLTIFIIYRAYLSYVKFPDVEVDYLNQYAYYLKNVHFLFYYFAIVGAILSLRNLKIGLLLILGFLVPFLFISKIIWLIHFRYIYFTLPLLFVLGSYSILYLFELSTYAGKYKKIATFGLVLLFGFAIFSNDFVFLPKKEYKLESGTPQPNFAKAYSSIKEQMQSGDIIISGFPAVDKYYLGKADYWIMFSLSGRQADINKYIINQTGKEVYVNASVIANVSELTKVTSVGRGWIILDNLAIRRINPSIMNHISSNLTYYPEFSEDIDRASGIKVYGWNRKIFK